MSVVTAIPTTLRDAAITAFRGRLCQQLNITPLVHQAKWWGATDGVLVLDQRVEAGEGVVVRLPSDECVTYATIPRPGGRARVIGDLGAFKIGKSMGAGLWAASFACVPNSRVSLVGAEYDMCAPEFDYICEALLSERGMGMEYTSLQNRPQDGKMWLFLPNGARVEAKSWERKESLKGKEVDSYVFCEAYQLPGLECYTGVSQNLRARNGYAVFPTTPDRPWLKEIHEAAHSGNPLFKDWHCTCGVSSSANPSTFSADALERDRGLMTREKFQIHHLGQLGDFVGRVYNYQRGNKVFTAATHPDLFTGSPPICRIPKTWDVVMGADTGTFSAAVVVAFSSDGDAFVLAEIVNYRYVGGSLELNETSTIPGWAANVVATVMNAGGRPIGWADRNSQFKREVQNYGLTLLPSTLPGEARTEISREYFTQGKIWLAEGLSVLPFELENAQWPEEATAAGKFGRVKDRDHALDCLEHVLSKRPRGITPAIVAESRTWAESFGLRRKQPHGNIHLGAR